MSNQIEAVFENGHFVPLHPSEVACASGDKVRLVIEPVKKKLPQEPNGIELMFHVMDGLSDKEKNEIIDFVLTHRLQLRNPT